MKLFPLNSANMSLSFVHFIVTRVMRFQKFHIGFGIGFFWAEKNLTNVLLVKRGI